MVESDQSSSDDELPPMAVPLGVQPPATDATKICDDTDSAPEPAAAPPQPVVPVMLLTGYLGAGKTTLVNHILTAKHGYRIAVLLNEIGDSADIERALVREPEGGAASALTDWVQLENGCICCSVKSDMVLALEALLAQRDRFDYVLIETTGLANPGPVAAALWTDPGLGAAVCLDAVVTVVDARHCLRQLRAPRAGGGVNEAQQQVAFADVVLLNKCDLAGEEELAAVEAALGGINSEAAVVRCRRCAVDLARVLHTGMYSAAGGAGPAAEAEAEAEEEEEQGEAQGHRRGDSEGAAGVHEHAHEHAHDHAPGGEGDAECGPACAHPSHSHDPGVRAVTVVVDRPLNLLRLRHWLDELLWERGADGGGGGGDGGGGDGGDGGGAPEVFRLKGLLSVAGGGRKWVLQGVHELYDVTEGPAWGAGPRRSKLVFIGRGLERAALARGLQGCCQEEGEGE